MMSWVSFVCIDYISGFYSHNIWLFVLTFLPFILLHLSPAHKVLREGRSLVHGFPPPPPKSRLVTCPVLHYILPNLQFCPPQLRACLCSHPPGFVSSGSTRLHPSSLLSRGGTSPALQAGRRRDERGRGPGLCAATQNFKRHRAHDRKHADRSHEYAGERRHAQLRSFNQSPQHLRVPLTQWGECPTLTRWHLVGSRLCGAVWVDWSHCTSVPSRHTASHQ